MFSRSPYNTYKNVPIHQAFYIEYTNSNVFLKESFSIHWLQNSDVAGHAIEILPYLKQFIKQAF